MLGYMYFLLIIAYFYLQLFLWFQPILKLDQIQLTYWIQGTFPCHWFGCHAELFNYLSLQILNVDLKNERPPCLTLKMGSKAPSLSQIQQLHLTNGKGCSFDFIMKHGLTQFLAEACPSLESILRFLTFENNEKGIKSQMQLCYLWGTNTKKTMFLIK